MSRKRIPVERIMGNMWCNVKSKGETKLTTNRTVVRTIQIDLYVNFPFATGKSIEIDNTPYIEFERIVWQTGDEDWSINRPCLPLELIRRWFFSTFKMETHDDKTVNGSKYYYLLQKMEVTRVRDIISKEMQWQGGSPFSFFFSNNRNIRGNTSPRGSCYP